MKNFRSWALDRRLCRTVAMHEAARKPLETGDGRVRRTLPDASIRYHDGSTLGSGSDPRADTESALVWVPRDARGQARPAVLVVFSEANVAPGAYPLGTRCRLGRGEESEIPLDDAKVSRAHGMITSDATGIHVLDLGSRNGTFLQGQPVGPRPVAAPPGSVLRIGRSLLLVAPDHARVATYPAGSRPPLIGGPALDPVREAIAQLARSRAPILIDGETGSGKEVTAELVHRSSGRAGPFVTVNCASLPADLVESELFGHRRGAFSGSDRAREGLFRSAHGGTIFLDEVGELPLELQTKLLRVLDSGEVRAVGDDEKTHVDVRVVAATNRAPEDMVTRGTLRADLFHRLAALRLTLPPLRDRREDIPLLLAHFLPEGMQADVLAVEKLLLHDWPGNVRELRHAIGIAVARAQSAASDRVSPDHVPAPRLSVPPPAPAAGGTELADVELGARIRTALSIRAGNMTQVAKDLGMSRSTLYEAVERLRIDPKEFRR